MVIIHSSMSSTYSSFRKNKAWKSGGGFYIYGDSDNPIQVNLTRIQLVENAQTSGDTNSADGGGGLYLNQKVTANIRECTFVRNEATEEASGAAGKQGHHIMTKKQGSNVPSVTIVNTNFTGLAGSHPFYGYDGSNGGADKYASSLTTCNHYTDPCTVSPFTGSCSAKTNALQGTICQGTPSLCPSKHYLNSVSESRLPPNSCTPWAQCGSGTYVSAVGSPSSDRTCSRCGPNAFQRGPTNQPVQSG